MNRVQRREKLNAEYKKTKEAGIDWEGSSVKNELQKEFIKTVKLPKKHPVNNHA